MRTALIQAGCEFKVAMVKNPIDTPFLRNDYEQLLKMLFKFIPQTTIIDLNAETEISIQTDGEWHTLAMTIYWKERTA